MLSRLHELLHSARRCAYRWASVPRILRRLEIAMSALSDQLNAATDQLTAVQDDVRVLPDRATVPTDDPEAQAAADRLTTFVSGWRAETPDADGSDTPTEEPTDPGAGTFR